MVCTILLNYFIDGNLAWKMFSYNQPFLVIESILWIIILKDIGMKKKSNNRTGATAYLIDKRRTKSFRALI